MIRNKKNLLFLLIISIVFFTGINKVSAGVECEYVSPFAKISHDGTHTIAMIINVLDGLNEGNGQSFSNLKELNLVIGESDEDSNTYIHKKYNISKGTYIYSMSITLEKSVKSYYTSWGSNEAFDIDALYFLPDSGPTLDKCPDYIRFKNENEGNNKYAEATSAEYDLYIRKQQYAGIDGYSTRFQTNVVTLSARGWVVIERDPFYSILTQNPVFVNKNLSYSFKDNAKNKKTNLDKLKEKIKEYGKEGAWEEIQPKMDTILNTHENDIRSHTPAFCNATESRVYNYVKDDIYNNTTNVNPAGKNNLKNWLYYCGRYLFEDQIEGMSGTNGVEKFSKYYKFLYGDSSDPTKVEKTSNYTQDEYSLIVDALDAMVGISNTSIKEETYKSNTCYVFCPACIKEGKKYNVNACSACTSGSSKSNEYSKCYSCVYGDKKCYSGLGATDMKNCLSNCMGDSTYEKYIEKKEEMEKEIEEDYKRDVDKLTYAFRDMGLLTFKYGLKPYKPKCKDVTFLTSIWNVIIVLAPFLLIIYSTFDYFKVVMAGDEEKMKVAKKKIPKRVIALVILLVFPAILKMLVSTFGTHGSENTKYIRCILSRDYGKDEEDDEDEKKEDEDKEDKENKNNN